MAENLVHQQDKMAVGLNNVDHNADSNIHEEIPSISKEELGQSYQRRLLKTPSMDTNPRKKGCFVITRVIQKSGVSDHADQDSVDDFDETNTEDFSSDILDTSKQTDIDPDQSSEDTVQSIATEDLSKETPSSAPVPDQPDDNIRPPPAQTQKPDPNLEQHSFDKIYNMQSLSRFKVVKIESSQPFRRGRWTCQDFLSPPTSERGTDKPEKSIDDIGSGNSSAASSVHYVPGVDDPAKNPLGETTFQSIDNQSVQASISSSVPSDFAAQQYDFAAALAQIHVQPVSNASLPTHTMQSPPAANHNQSMTSQSSVPSQPYENFDGTQQPFQPASSTQSHTNGQGQVQSQAPNSFNQVLPSISQTQLQSKPSEQQTTEYIPTSVNIPSQEYIHQQSQQDFINQAAAASTQQQQQQQQTPVQPGQDFLPQGQPTSTQKPDYPAGSVPPPGTSAPQTDASQPPPLAPVSNDVGGATGGGEYQAPVASAVATSTTSSEPIAIPKTSDQQSDTGYQPSSVPDVTEKPAEESETSTGRHRQTSISGALKGVGAQSLLTPPLLEMVTAMQPQGNKDEERWVSFNYYC